MQFKLGCKIHNLKERVYFSPSQIQLQLAFPLICWFIPIQSFVTQRVRQWTRSKTRGPGTSASPGKSLLPPARNFCTGVFGTFVLLLLGTQNCGVLLHWTTFPKVIKTIPQEGQRFPYTLPVGKPVPGPCCFDVPQHPVGGQGHSWDCRQSIFPPRIPVWM